MDRLTKGEIERWRDQLTALYLKHSPNWTELNALCDLALQSFSQEAVRDEDLACAQENFHVTNQAYVKADARIAELEKLLGEALENLIWCGGSADFGWGGKAQVGYDKGPRATIAAIHEALKSRA